MILYYAGRNDHSLNNNSKRYPGPVIWGRGRFLFFKAWVIFKKVQLRFVLLKWFGFDLETIFPYPNNWKANYTDNLKEMIAVAKKSKVLFVIITQVMDYPLDVFENMGSNPDKFVKILQMKNKNWHRFLRQNDLLGIQSEITKENDLKVIDLHADFFMSTKSGVQAFYDNVHLSPEGNKSIAKGLVSNVEQELNKQYIRND